MSSMMSSPVGDDSHARLREAEAAMPDMTTLRIGEARVTLINAGDMRLILARELEVP